MRVSPRDLRGISRDGMLVRFAMLGPVAYVHVEVPAAGSAGTGFETPSQNAGWGLVLRGHVTLHGATVRELPAGTAFYVPPGPPDHYFSAKGGTVIAGFAPVRPDSDTSEEELRRQGFDLLRTPGSRRTLPETMHPQEPSSIFSEPGSIEVETAMMGAWLFARTTFGPLSGYTSGWCDLPHWGLVLRGDFGLKTEQDVELMGAGDVYYCPSGPPGHQFQVVDSATTIDYTPIAEFDGPGRIAEWRWSSWRRQVDSEGAEGDARAPRYGRTETASRADRPDLISSAPLVEHSGRGVVRRGRNLSTRELVPVLRSSG